MRADDLPEMTKPMSCRPIGGADTDAPATAERLRKSSFIDRAIRQLDAAAATRSAMARPYDDHPSNFEKGV